MKVPRGYCVFIGYAYRLNHQEDTKAVPVEAVIEDVLRIPLELMTVTGYEKGYEQNKKYGTELDENWNRLKHCESGMEEVYVPNNRKV